MGYEVKSGGAESQMNDQIVNLKKIFETTGILNSKINVENLRDTEKFEPKHL